MILMGLKDEATATADYIATHLSFDADISVKNFEITIRTLGGLLSAYQLTGDERLQRKADDLGQRLLPVFNSRTGKPYMYVNLKTGATRGAESNPAEIGTLILEFGTLAKLTGKPVYFDKAKRALVALYERRDTTTGLVGEWINVETGAWTNTASHVGGAIDSYYEYLLKCERLFGDRQCGDMWRASVPAIHKYLADDTATGRWYGVADMRTGARTKPVYGSLHAFFPWLRCSAATRPRATPVGIRHAHVEPARYRARGVRLPRDAGHLARYQLRPEIIESAYYLAHATGDEAHVRMGATISAT
jgi:mannosidase alpha-like ER degradation enhancer 2